MRVSTGTRGFSKNLRVFFKWVNERVTDGFFLFAGRVAGRHYPYPTRPVVISSCTNLVGIFGMLISSIRLAP